MYLILVIWNVQLTQKPKEVPIQHIILAAHHTKNGIVFNISDLEARLNQLTDSRDKRGKIYPLGMILTMVILAKLAGKDKPSGIAQWIRLRGDAFVRIFRWFLKENQPTLLGDVKQFFKPARMNAGW
ncbi:MAG: hypothetical protein CSB13_08605, partial [Chloroflexi bacterium]